ncbi:MULTISPECIES: DUF1133 family protein [Serratia]|uniref:DUF1133 family protein n=2 Tax=Serratia TaxID=613 RepID=A0ABT7GJX1_9GAMM|nr:MULTISPECIES: DUF1133 family protein [Serratia]MDK4799118.1 DUF1133 family protein [Serratia nevei]MDK4861397.1 DUF1133 family protein [Serratia nevei]MDK4941167.1 DUF1133 family protein [Serratia nevei]MDK5067340.1 DUF1133 family protein [Serratia nevei]MDK5111604.1 DUF1133 family protein [Serratia nevei]
MKTDVWHQLASAPRKSYLGKTKKLSPVQERWIRSVLHMWGEYAGGNTAPTTACGVIGRLMISTHWDENSGSKIIQTVEHLYENGYRGTELFLKAKEIINPRNSFANILRLAKEGEEGKFIDGVICEVFSQSSPIRAVAIKYYCDREDMQSIANYLNRVYAPGLTTKQCIDRVRWCREIFHETMYAKLAANVSLKSEKLAA